MLRTTKTAQTNEKNGVKPIKIEVKGIERQKYNTNN
jgi:hypothetical protein